MISEQSSAAGISLEQVIITSHQAPFDCSKR